MKAGLMILIAALAFTNAAVAAQQVKCPACGHQFETPYEGN